jgi:NAD(P)-dependent dehydrogenase (short-subunit alcohol dehydrogenase family)
MGYAMSIFENKIAIVTGAASGIGQALARDLANQGADVVLADVQIDAANKVAAYAVMIRQGAGHIVNTASVAGLVPSPGFTAYCASKHAVVGFSTSLRAEAAEYGVKVSAVCPGFIKTPMFDSKVVGIPKDRKNKALNCTSPGLIAQLASDRISQIDPLPPLALPRSGRSAPTGKEKAQNDLVLGQSVQRRGGELFERVALMP